MGQTFLRIAGLILFCACALAEEECTLIDDLKRLKIQSRLNRHLVGHWKMDEQEKNNVDDDSGNELHGMATSTTKVSRGKFTRGRYFSSTSDNIIVPKSPLMDFGSNSFSFAGWIKAENYTYPHTAVSARQGFGCYFKPGRPGFTAGWEIGHGHSVGNDKTSICIRDDSQNYVFKYIKHDAGFQGAALLNKWAHFTIAFDRHAQRVYLYINGKKQDDYADISKVKGSINNDKPLNFGTLYGWKTKGTIDDYRMYNIALKSEEVAVIFENHRL